METIEKACPVCSSKKIEEKKEDKQLEFALGPTLSYQSVYDRCLDCEFEGDFLSVNDKTVEAIRAKGKVLSMEMTINGLAGTGASIASIERALELAPRTMARWKTGKFSDAALALVRILFIYPWVVDVADERFDRAYADLRLIKESGAAVERLANCFGKTTLVEVDATSENTKATVSFQDISDPSSAKTFIGQSTTTSEPVKIPASPMPALL